MEFKPLSTMSFDAFGGTTFVVSDGDVEITRSDQPVCVIPLADIREFVRELKEDLEAMF